jgi:hypothetical protein
MIEKPKKERRFLKTLGIIGEILLQEVLLKVGSNLVKRIGGKKTLPSILFLFLSICLYGQYPATGNKQRLGYQTSGDGLVYRGRALDTMTIKSSGLNNAYFILDTVNNILYNYIKTKGGWKFSNGDTIIINNNFTQPVDSLFFKTSVSPNNVDTAKMRWDAELGTVVLGMYDKVPNELGFKNFWLVKNQTGSTITKGSLVYANGTVGASGRITVAKFIANGTIDAKYLLGITAHDLSNGEDGYVISFGKIRQVNTDTFAAGAILYPSPTVAGVWTDVEPVAPNIDLPIGFCINSHVNNGTIAIRVASGYSLNELHDLAISSPAEKSSLYYSGGLWRDTTAALLTSDTASMLTPYFRDADTTSLNLVSRFATKLNISDTSSMLTNYLQTGVAGSTYLTQSSAASTYLPLVGGTISGTINRQEGSNDGSTSTFYYNILNYFARRDNVKGNQTAQITFTDRPGTSTFENNVRTSDIYLMTAKNYNGLSLGQFLDTTLSIVANQDGGRIGISKLNPAYKLDVNGTFNASGNSLIGGTLGVSSNLNVTGQSTLLNKVFVGNFTDNTPTSGDNYNVRLESNDVSSIGFHDAGNTIANIKFSAATGFVIGASDGTYGPHSTTMAGATTLSGALTVNNATVLNEGSGDFDTRIESDGNANMVFVDASTDRVGIGTGSPSNTLDVNGTLGVTGIANFTNQMTISGSVSGSNRLLGKNTSNNGVGDITIGTGLSLTSNNLTASGTDTTSLSDRINLKYNSSGGTISGAVTLSTTTATPTALLGKDGSNVVGEVTDINQSGVMKVGSTTQNTSSVGIINVAHGLSYTPTKVIATIAQQSSYVIVCHGITSTNLNFTIYDSTDGTALDNVSVGFFWIAFK